MRLSALILLLLSAGTQAATPPPARTGAGNCCSKPTPLPRSATYCGAVGKLRGKTQLLTRFSSSSNDVNACYSACLKDARCVSFGFNTKTKSCRTLGANLQSQGFTPDSKSTRQFWELKGCFDLSCLSKIEASKTSTSIKISTTNKTPTPTSKCQNIVKNPGFDDANNTAWVGNPQFRNDPANAQSPPKYAFFYYHNNTGAQNSYAQYLIGFDATKTYSGSFWVKIPTFAPKPLNPDYQVCQFSANFGAYYPYSSAIDHNIFPQWTQIKFSGIKLESSAASLIFSLRCDSGYVGPGTVEMWLDTISISADSC